MKKEQKKKQNRKIKQWWDTFKLLWANTRCRAMIKFGIYIIFLGGVFIFIQIANIMNRNANKVVYKTPLERFSEQTTYQYQMKLEELNTTLLIQEINGEMSAINHKFTIDSDFTSYIIQDHLYYRQTEHGMVAVSNPLLFDVDKLTPSKLKELIDSGEEVSNTTYKNGLKETSYEVPLKDFIKIYTDMDQALSGTIICKLQLKDQTIEKLEIDWTNYRKLQVPTVVSSNLTIVIK